MFQVLLHNDDYTTREFVIMILCQVFRKPEPEAARIMMAVHTHGIGVAGVYPHEVAETKVHVVTELAKAHGYPLKCTVEAE